jgi:hypothetical protein
MKKNRYKLKDVGAYNLDKVKIPDEFAKHPPKAEKIIQKMLSFNRTSELEDIIVDENFCLVDGYCSYLIAQQVGPAFVKIKMITQSKGRRKDAANKF